MTFRDHNIITVEDDFGNMKELECDERYYVPSELTWLLKILGFKKIDIYGAKLGVLSRNDKLTTEDFEMLVIGFGNFLYPHNVGKIRHSWEVVENYIAGQDKKPKDMEIRYVYGGYKHSVYVRYLLIYRRKYVEQINSDDTGAGSSFRTVWIG